MSVIVLSLTLIIFALFFGSQNKAIQEQAYQKVMDDYGDAMRKLSERPELYAFQLELFNIRGATIRSIAKILLSRGNGHPQLRHHALRILRKNLFPL